MKYLWNKPAIYVAANQFQHKHDDIFGCDMFDVVDMDIEFASGSQEAYCLSYHSGKCISTHRHPGEMSWCLKKEVLNIFPNLRRPRGSHQFSIFECEETRSNDKKRKQHHFEQTALANKLLWPTKSTETPSQLYAVWSNSFEVNK